MKDWGVNGDTPVVFGLGGFGLPFPAHEDRVAMVGEAVEVIRLLSTGEKVSFAGRWYQLAGAQIEPRPERVWVGVGGNSGPSLKVAAQADEWCTAGASVAELRPQMAELDRLARQAGRNRWDIERALMTGVLVGRDEAELRRRAKRLAAMIPELKGRTTAQILDRAATEWGWWIGTPEQVVDQVGEVIDAGVDHVFFQLFDFRDLDALGLLASEMLPRLPQLPQFTSEISFCTSFSASGRRRGVQ